MLANLRIWSTIVRRGPLTGSILITAAVGIFLVSFIPLENLSYDVSTWLKPTTTVTNAVVVYEDKETGKLGTDPAGKLNRTFYARLLDILRQDQAKLVFMDVIFQETSSIPGADQMLTSAIRNQGSVILVSGSDDMYQPGSSFLRTLSPPIQTLADAAKGWGHADVLGDAANAVRQISENELVSYAGWVAATNLAPKLQLVDEDSERWLNYYGSPDSGAIAGRWLQDVISNNVPAGFFTSKIVLVGQGFPYRPTGKQSDTVATPYSRFDSALSAGVLVHATALLNLIQGEWLTRIPRPWQWLQALSWSFVTVGLFYALSPKSKIVIISAAICAIVALCAVSLWLQWTVHWWWAWIGPAFIQTPLALTMVMLNPRKERYIAFISYRTEEDGAAALLIKKSLAEHGYRTFVDVQSLHAGKFDEQLLREIESAAFFILILSPKSLERCANEGDWVLKELTHALADRKKIIPILKSGFRFDAPEGIPNLPQIKELEKYNGVVYSNSDFEGFIKKLIGLLNSV